MFEPVAAGAFDLVTGTVGNFKNKYGTLTTHEDADGNRAVVLQNLPKFDPPETVAGWQITRIDAGLNYFVGNRDRILEMGAWSPEIKITHEHFTFFYRLQRAGYRVGYSNDATIGHPPFKRVGEYKKKRAGRGIEFLEAGMREMGVETFVKKRGNRQYHYQNAPGRSFDWTTAKTVEPHAL